MAFSERQNLLRQMAERMTVEGSKARVPEVIPIRIEDNQSAGFCSEPVEISARLPGSPASS